MINNNQKGVSVYLTIVILAVLLSVSLGLVGIIIGGAKIAGGLGNSVKAFHAADTGMEKALYCVKTNGGDCTLSLSCANDSNTFSAGYGWTVAMLDSGGVTCTSSVSSIESEGTYSTTKRKVETSY
jgi:hypothetical protein